MVLIPYYIAFCLLCCLFLLVIMRRDRDYASRVAATPRHREGDGQMSPAYQPEGGQAAPRTTIRMAA